jgi:hypothetical protein
VKAIVTVELERHGEQYMRSFLDLVAKEPAVVQAHSGAVALVRERGEVRTGELTAVGIPRCYLSRMCDEDCSSKWATAAIGQRGAA